MKKQNHIKRLVSFSIQNYKTTLPGVAIAVTAYLQVRGFIDAHTSALIISLLTALGLTGAKDADKKEEQ